MSLMKFFFSRPVWQSDIETDPLQPAHLGRHGVAAAAAAGVLLTVTGIVGGLCFAAWASGDRLWVHTRRTERPGS